MSMPDQTILEASGGRQRRRCVCDAVKKADLPDDEPLVVEALLLNRDAGFVRAGMKVAVKLDAYADHALTFHFARRINTLEADFRIDGGPAHRWRDEFPALVRVGAPLQNTSMTNPTGGLVTLPIDELKGAHTVAIRSTPKSRPELFTIDGFADAISAAEARGCPDSP